MFRTENMSPIRRDFVISNLRLQLQKLRKVVNSLETEQIVDCDYAEESLKEVAINLHRIRKLCG